MRLASWLLLLSFTAALLSGCERITNSPHAAGAEQTNTFFTAFEERSPRYLDPTASYAIDETPFTYSVYEPLYRFHYLKRPYEIVPRIAEAVAVPRYFDKAGNELPADARGEDIAEAVYDIKIKTWRPLCATSGIHTRCERKVSIPLALRRRVRRQTHAVRLRGPGNARVDRTRLRVRDSPAGNDAHQVGVFFIDGGAHRRAEGVRRADRCGRQGTAQEAWIPRAAICHFSTSASMTLPAHRRSTTTRCAFG